MEILKRNVLVVDDDTDWLDLIERKLKRFGAQVLRARDGVEAVSLLDRYDFDLVITDTNMPYMDGVSLLKFIRLGFAKVPVIVFLSGLPSSPFSGEEVQKIGATAVLEKRDAPSHLDLLLNRFLGPPPKPPAEIRSRKIRFSEFPPEISMKAVLVTKAARPRLKSS